MDPCRHFRLYLTLAGRQMGHWQDALGTEERDWQALPSFRPYFPQIFPVAKGLQFMLAPLVPPS